MTTSKFLAMRVATVATVLGTAISIAQPAAAYGGGGHNSGHGSGHGSMGHSMKSFQKFSGNGLSNNNVVRNAKINTQGTILNTHANNHNNHSNHANHSNNVKIAKPLKTGSQTANGTFLSQHGNNKHTNHNVTNKFANLQHQGNKFNSHNSNDSHHHHHHGFPLPSYAWFGLYPYLYGNGYNSGYYPPTYVNTTTPIYVDATPTLPTTLADATTPNTGTTSPVAFNTDDVPSDGSGDAPAIADANPTADAGIDLQLVDVRMLDQGDASQQIGPRYRVTFRNAGSNPVNHEFNVALVASDNGNPATPNQPVIESRVAAVPAGKQTSVDLRLPSTAFNMGSDSHSPFSKLFVFVDSHQEVNDGNRNNNATGLDRTAIRPAT